MPNAVDTLIAAFPWLGQLGLQEKLIEWARDGITGDALVGMVRQTEQWKSRFVGIKRSDGTLRMNEARYLDTEDSFRTLLRQWGQPDYKYDNPADFQAFFDGDVSPAELQKRFEVYRQIELDAGPLKDAFYVYAGMKIDDDQWYQYFTDRTTRAQMDQEYDQRTTAGTLDYQTFITRSTEVGLNRLEQAVKSLGDQYITTDETMSQIRNLNPDQARSIVDVLFHGGDPGAGQTLSLEELINAFEFAMIGSAATQQGLDLPSRERIQAMRQAGIDRARALERYSSYAQQKNLVQSIVQRAGGGTFGQDEFEKAVFLSQADDAELLRRAQAQETALGQAGGSAAFGQKGRQISQRGLGLS